MTEARTGRPERRYSPSSEKIVPDEANTPQAREYANSFVDYLYHQMDGSEHGPNAIVPTSRDIIADYQARQSHPLWQHDPEGRFTLREAYGAAKRKLLSQRELAAEYGGTSQIAMRNIGDMYILMTAIELALPASQRPPLQD